MRRVRGLEPTFLTTRHKTELEVRYPKQLKARNNQASSSSTLAFVRVANVSLVNTICENTLGIFIR